MKYRVCIRTKSGKPQTHEVTCDVISAKDWWLFFLRVVTEQCRRCEGKGQTSPSDGCPTCGGEGETQRTEAVGGCSSDNLLWFERVNDGH